ncbi:MAG TPA: DUF4381 family protein [Longimicrobium sp.]|jgi:MYXO-CTERM domain-containing protein|uniref:DUF4381 family protein n=1 Tax=Longimicrobium sp. TaxID=2029185 RepID=UPI002EDB2489
MRRLLPLAFLLAVAAQPVTGQNAPLAARTDCDTVLAGEPFTVTVDVRGGAAGADAKLEFPASGGAWQASGPAVPSDSAGVRRLAVPMVAWIPGPAHEIRAELRAGAEGGAEPVPVRIQLPTVRPVLPADSANPRPRPARGIVPLAEDGPPWGWIAVGAAAALVILLALFLWRKRKHGTATPAGARREALAELDRLRASGLMETGDLEGFYARQSAILRDFAAAADPELGGDLTTLELIGRLGARGDGDAAAGAAEVLGAADLAKFARRPPSAERALRDWTAAREWVAAFRAGEDADEADGGAG